MYFANFRLLIGQPLPPRNLRLCPKPNILLQRSLLHRRRQVRVCGPQALLDAGLPWSPPLVLSSPVDALHGDLGIIFPNDLLILISKSGSSDKLLNLVPCARAKGVRLIAVTSVEGNPLAKACDMIVHLPLEGEVCPFRMAPVTSAAIHMVFGDTVVAAIMRARRLTVEQYAANHPAGRIEKSLIFKVKDVMKKHEELSFCKEGDMIMNQLADLTGKGYGCLLVVDDSFRLLGTFTDGDLRRTLKASGKGIFKLTVGEMCNRSSRQLSSNGEPDRHALLEPIRSPAIIGPSPVLA